MADMSNDFAKIIKSGNGSLAKDLWAKRLFSLKSVVASLVKACVPEYKRFETTLITDECLEDFQDDMGRIHSDFAKVLLTTRPLPNGYDMTNDLIFELHPPKFLRGKQKSQLLNIEVQNDSRKLDRCLARGMLYVSSIYYQEYGAIFKYPYYEKGWRVNSIWICPAAPRKYQGTILDFRTTRRCKPEGRCSPCRESYDKFRMTFINVGGKIGRGQKDIRGFVWTLTTPLLGVEERKMILQEDFNMKMTQEVEESIEDHEEMMMNFYGRKRYKTDMRRSWKDGERRGLFKGEEIGLAKGEEIGLAKGEEIGLARAEESIVLNMLKMKYPLEKIVRATCVSEDRILQIARIIYNS